MANARIVSVLLAPMLAKCGVCTTRKTIWTSPTRFHKIVVKKQESLVVGSRADQKLARNKRNRKEPIQDQNQRITNPSIGEIKHNSFNKSAGLNWIPPPPDRFKEGRLSVSADSDLTNRSSGSDYYVKTSVKMFAGMIESEVELDQFSDLADNEKLIILGLRKEEIEIREDILIPYTESFLSGGQTPAKQTPISLRLMCLGIISYPEKFASLDCKNAFQAIVLKNFKAMSVLESSMACLVLFRMRLFVRDPDFNNFVIQQVIANLESRRNDILLGSLIKQLMLVPDGATATWRIMLMQKWLTSGSPTRDGVLWSQICRYLSHADMYSLDFAMKVREFLMAAIAEQIATFDDRARSDSEKANYLNSQLGADIPGKSQYFVRAKDVDRCLTYLRLNVTTLPALSKDKTEFLPQIVDYLDRTEVIESFIVRRNAHCIISILASMAYVDYFPKRLFEKVTDDTFFRYFFGGSHPPASDLVIFLDHCLKVEQPEFPRFSTFIMNKVNQHPGFGVKVQPTPDFDSVVQDVSEILNCDVQDMITETQFTVFPYREIIVSFQNGKLCPARIKDMPIRIPKETSDQQRWLVITVFGSKKPMKSFFSGLYLVKKRQLSKLGMECYEMRPYSVEPRRNQLKKLKKFLQIMINH